MGSICRRVNKEVFQRHVSKRMKTITRVKNNTQYGELNLGGGQCIGKICIIKMAAQSCVPLQFPVGGGELFCRSDCTFWHFIKKKKPAAFSLFISLRFFVVVLPVCFGKGKSLCFLYVLRSFQTAVLCQLWWCAPVPLLFY